MFNTTYSYETRQADSGMVRSVGTTELDIAKDSFKWRAVDLFNQRKNTVVQYYLSYEIEVVITFYGKKLIHTYIDTYILVSHSCLLSLDFITPEID